MKHLLTILFLALLCIPGYSQFAESAYIDIGSSQVSSGAYMRAASITGYRIKNYEMQLGLQTMFGSAERKVFSGMFADVSGDYLIKGFSINANIFFRHNPFSDLVSETNFGLMVRHSWDHIEMHLGYHSRIYSLKKDEVDQGDLEDPDLRIYEWRNFMYKGILWLRPRTVLLTEQPDRHWNAGAALTNFDYFLIQQETNPILQGMFYYKLNPTWILYGECWYQGAGMLNLSANYYGFYIRTGFRWQIN